jgi:hypothetical protein
MQRIHSDVSEYDAQGNLLKRTITDSYTSIADAAMAPPQLHASSPEHPAPTIAESPPATESTIPHVPSRIDPNSRRKARKLHCPYCPDFPRFPYLTAHLCFEHSDILAPASRARKLKILNERRTGELRRALRLLTRPAMGDADLAELRGRQASKWAAELLEQLGKESGFTSLDEPDDLDSDSAAAPNESEEDGNSEDAFEADNTPLPLPLPTNPPA